MNDFNLLKSEIEEYIKRLEFDTQSYNCCVKFFDDRDPVKQEMKKLVETKEIFKHILQELKKLNEVITEIFVILMLIEPELSNYHRGTIMLGFSHNLF